MKGKLTKPSLLEVVTMFIIGFAGGVIAHLVLIWLPQAKSGSVDPIAIANTYIVFTTFIFAGLSAVVGIGVFYVTQQFSEHKEAAERQVIDAICEKIRADEKTAIQISNTMLENGDVKRHLNEKFSSKLDELIRARKGEVAAEDAALTALQEDIHATNGGNNQ